MLVGLHPTADLSARGNHIPRTLGPLISDSRLAKCCWRIYSFICWFPQDGKQKSKKGMQLTWFSPTKFYFFFKFSRIFPGEEKRNGSDLRSRFMAVSTATVSFLNGERAVVVLVVARILFSLPSSLLFHGVSLSLLLLAALFLEIRAETSSSLPTVFNARSFILIYMTLLFFFFCCLGFLKYLLWLVDRWWIRIWLINSVWEIRFIFAPFFLSF